MMELCKYVSVHVYPRKNYLWNIPGWYRKENKDQGNKGKEQQN